MKYFNFSHIEGVVFEVAYSINRNLKKSIIIYTTNV